MRCIPLLCTTLNAGTAVTQLPAELVVKIFMSDVWTEWYKLLSLTHICQHWYNIVQGMPQLWANVVASIFKLGI